MGRISNFSVSSVKVGVVMFSTLSVSNLIVGIANFNPVRINTVSLSTMIIITERSIMVNLALLNIAP